MTTPRNFTVKPDYYGDQGIFGLQTPQTAQTPAATQMIAGMPQAPQPPQLPQVPQSSTDGNPVMQVSPGVPPAPQVSPGVTQTYQQPAQQSDPNGGWYNAINNVISNWQNQGTAYNDQQANRLASLQRVQGDDISKAFSQAANARAGSGIMGGTESQGLLGNLLGGLRQDVQNRRTGYLENAWNQNSGLMGNAAQARMAAMNAAQQGNVTAQQNAMNLITQAMIAAPGSANLNLTALANLLGLGQQSNSSSTSNSTSDSGDPTKKYEIIANML